MPIEAPNTLRSRARYKIIDIISQGPCKGLVNGAKSVFLNDTPIQASDGTLNFKNFRASTDLQELPITDVSGQLVANDPTKFPLSENEVNVAVKVTKDSPEGSGSGDGSVTRTITDTDVDSVRVTLRVPALTTTNTTTGDITGGKIAFQIYVKPDGGEFMPVSCGSQWSDLAAHDSETDSTATGIELTATLSGAKSTGRNGIWQYRKKTGEEWGAWVTFATVSTPATSSSSMQNGWFVGGGWMPPEEFTRSITGLEPGIYQAQITSTFGTVTPVSARQFSDASLTIEGKTVSPYDSDYIVQLPGDGPWDIKVSRITADPPSANIQADLYWLSYTEQISNRFSWPNTAGVAITFDAEDFGSEIPTRSYDFMGLEVQIPINYDPYLRTYDGVWNGTFKTDWTDNPAWIFYDLLTNKRYGLGDNIDATQIDKYALYQIAQYCDELVDAPNGEEEPRYTCSCVINTQSEAYELLTAIASAFRGMIYHSGGMITPVADMPSDPVLNVGPANVIDGNFTYQGASRKARHTVARVSWNNPDDGYKLNVELYEDTEAIRKYGYRPVDINAFGCTSRGLARRWGKWAISSDNDAPDTVTYKAGFDHFKLRPGDVINISDPNYSGEQLFGLIADVTDNVSPATHTITLDRAVTRVAGDTSELQLTLADGTILLLDVAVTGSDVTSDEITVDSAELTTIPLAGASWLLKKGTVEPRQWRVVSISEDEPHVYQVTAMLYDPNKFDKVESDLNFAEADFTAFPSGPMPAPTGVAISEFLKQTGSAIIACVNLSWTRPNDPRADWFEVQYQLDGEEWRTTEPNLTQFTGIDIINIIPGTYNFRVRAQDTSGLFRSAWTTLSSQTLLGKNKAPEDVTGLTNAIEKYGIMLNWSPVSDIDIDYYEIRIGASWADGVSVGKAKATVFKYEDVTTTSYKFWVKAIDTSGNESNTAATTTATITVQTTPSVTAVPVNGGIELRITGVVDRGFKCYEIQRKSGAEGEFTTINSNVLTRTFVDSDITTLAYGSTWIYRVRSIDNNDDTSAWSDETAATGAKQIETSDITSNQLIGKDIRTACNVGNGTVSGVLMNSAGIEGWNGATKNFCLNASNGHVMAKAGTIGGWTLGSTYLCSGNLIMDSAGNLRGNFVSGCSGWCIGTDGSAEFNRVVARGCFIGDLLTENGMLGGFCFDCSVGQYAGSGATRIQFQPGCGIWMGATAFDDAPFRVPIDGSYLITPSLYVCGVACVVGVFRGGIGAQTTSGTCDWNDISNARAGQGWTLLQGSRTNGPGTGSYYHPFSFEYYQKDGCGNMTQFAIPYVASNYSHIYYRSRYNSNWCGWYRVISANSSGNVAIGHIGTPSYTLDVCGHGYFSCCIKTPFIESPNYMSGLSGWRIDSIGCSEFHAAVIRGELRSAMFVYDEISAVGGQTLIANSGTLKVCATTASALANSYSICIDDPQSAHAARFAVNDILRFKTFNGTCIVDAWGRVSCVVDCTTYYQYCVVHCSGSCSAVIPKGTAVVSYGPTSTGGGILLNGQGACSPYLDIFTNSATPWSCLCGRVRLGNLSGISGFSGCGYGLWTDNGLIVGGVIQSSNWAAGAGSCFDLTGGCFALGGSSSPKLSWDGSTLAVNGVVTANSGYIGGATGWLIASCLISSSGGTCGDIRLLSNALGCNVPAIIIRANTSSTCTYLSFGGYHNTGSSVVDCWGINLRVANSNLFTVLSNSTGTGIACAQIAGWNFNHQCLWSGNLILSCSGYISGCYCSGSTGWIINSNGSAEFNDVTVRGTVCSCCGLIGGFTISCVALYSSPGATTSVGFYADTTIGVAIWAGCNNPTLAPFRVNHAGCLIASNATISGTICASCGCIGGFCTTSSLICSTPAAGCSVGISSCSTSGAIAFWAGCSTMTEAPFRVYNTGAAVMSSGRIGGFDITSNKLYVGCSSSGVCYEFLICQQGPSSGIFAWETGETIESGISYQPGSFSVTLWQSGVQKTLVMLHPSLGDSASYAPLKIQLASTSYYAMCSNGRIYVNSVYCASDCNLKTDIQRVSVLEQLRQLPITKWRFKDSQDYQIGPMAQDYHRIFRLNHDWENNTSIGGVSGIALRAVQEVDSLVQHNSRQIIDLQTRIKELEKQIDAIKKSA